LLGNLHYYTYIYQYESDEVPKIELHTVCEVYWKPYPPQVRFPVISYVRI